MMHKILKNLILTSFVCMVLTCCSQGYDSTAVDGSCGPAIIYPDYKDVTVPANVAPLNFHYAVRGAEKAVTVFSIGDKTVKIKGREQGRLSCEDCNIDCGLSREIKGRVSRQGRCSTENAG